ncbi:PREDICTED: uncharacterized protein LOC105558017 [Vollenhovia emeryi]|uniref:uncharacterized protein LOC105558017 n=1 Tax=Vollenhovia emeryi TaxID=411798 RepID=UPI0005F3CC1A|nr:PREDICTED: uncharacterized protein LOC105558017 [Vollenhovia emeryi]
MNVTLIPFFLAANVVVHNPAEWTFGQEYLYDVNISYDVKPDSFGSKKNYQLLTTLSCRPKMRNYLLYQFKNGSHVKRTSTKDSIVGLGGRAEDMFEIKFTERGVESLIVDRTSYGPDVQTMRKIANQFNVIDDRKNLGKRQFIRKVSAR